jgi:uncharacterized protein (DUF2344 family)
MKKETEVTISVPFSYTLGEEGYKTGKVLNTVEDCKEEVKAELTEIIREPLMQLLRKDLTVYVVEADNSPYPLTKQTLEEAAYTQEDFDSEAKVITFLIQEINNTVASEDYYYVVDNTTGEIVAY